MDVNNDQNNDEDLNDLGQTNISEGSSITLTKELYESFVQKAFSIKPTLQKAYDESKATDLITHTKRHIRENRNPIMRKRKQEFIDVMYNNVNRVLGSKVASSVAKQLKGNDSISTTQHAGLLCGKNIIYTTLLSSLPYFGKTHPNIQNVIVLGCSLISFNNYSTPKDLQLNVMNSEGKIKQKTLSFFGRQVDPLSVLFHPSYTNEDIEEIYSSINRLRSEKSIDQQQAERLHEFISEVFGNPHILSAKTYLDQTAIGNYYLFKKLFSDYKGNVPNLIYLSLEEIVLDTILNYHINKETTLQKILFDPKMHDLLEKHFEGISGAFSLEKMTGTFLFWGYPKNSKYKVQLFRKDGFLVSPDGSFKVELKPEAIAQAIKNKELAPGFLMGFIVLYFYYGLTVTGGYRQVYDVSVLMDIYKKVLEEYGDTESLQALEGLVTTNMVLPSATLYSKFPSGEYIPATSVDIFMNWDKKAKWEDLFDSFSKINFSEIMSKIAPIVYSRFCPPEEKEEKFMGITEKDVDNYTKFPQKPEPILEL